MDDLQPVPRPPEGVCELWWAQTVYGSSVGGLAVDVPDQFVHIWGHLHYGGDPLLAGSVGYTEDDVLSRRAEPAAVPDPRDARSRGGRGRPRRVRQRARLASQVEGAVSREAEGG